MSKYNRYDDPMDAFLARAMHKNGCLEWTGAKNDVGYGQLWDGEKVIYAHRFSYEHFVGPIKDKLCVLHTCDNPACVNPNHLFLGTKRDNTNDALKKGRLKLNYDLIKFRWSK